MDLAEITELKEGLEEFEMDLRRDVEEDTEYNGEADAVLLAIERLRSRFQNVNTPDDFKKIEAEIAPDLQYVMEAAASFSDFDEEGDFDFEDDEDFDEDDLSFAEEEDEDEE